MSPARRRPGSGGWKPPPNSPFFPDLPAPLLKAATREASRRSRGAANPRRRWRPSRRGREAAPDRRRTVEGRDCAGA